MALSPELAEFCHNWRAKADTCSGDNLRGAFDRFFTLWVVFNRLYAEATFRLARRGRVKERRDRFPDSLAATDYVLQYLGAKALTHAWESDRNTSAALREIADHLRESRFALNLDANGNSSGLPSPPSVHPPGRFALHLDWKGNPLPDADRELLASLGSCNRCDRGKAGLKALYQIRCNMFHGHKGFEPVQLELLRPAILLLESTIEALHRALDTDPEVREEPAGDA
jgi:hypothetical protein